MSRFITDNLLQLDGADRPPETRFQIQDRLALLEERHAPTFDRLTRIVTRLLDTPVSLVSMVASDFQYFVGQTGLNDPYATLRETSLDLSFCIHVVENDAPLIVNDARQHPELADNPAIDELGVIGYLGVPVHTRDNTVLGSFCAITHEPRDWTDEDVAIMTDLVELVADQIDRLQQSQQRHTAERESAILRILRNTTRDLSNKLRDPLTSLQLKIDWLQRTDSSEDSAQRLSEAQEKLREVRDILNDFSRIWDVNVQQQHITPIDVHSIIRSVVYALTDANKRNGNGIRLSLSAHNRMTLIDAQLLHIALRHILWYLLKQTDPQAISIKTHNDAPYFVITMQLAAQVLTPEKITKRYGPLLGTFDVPDMSSDTLVNTVIAHQIITSQGGKIRVQSDAETGTSIVVSILSAF